MVTYYKTFRRGAWVPLTVIAALTLSLPVLAQNSTAAVAPSTVAQAGSPVPSLQMVRTGQGVQGSVRQSADAPSAAQQNWNVHFQNTDVVQGDLAFPAKYSGTDSLSNKSQVQETVTADLFAGRRLWSGAEAHADLLTWQGFGLSQTYGIEAYPNGDAYKAGTQTPDFNFAHLFIRQTIGLGGPQEDIPDDQLTLAGREDISRLTLTIGRFSPLDMCDNNTYAQDPHTQFMNWAMMGNLTWDYGQDTIGYGPGLMVELKQPKWTLRYGFFSMPADKNGFTGDDQFLMYPPSGAFGPIFRDWAMNVEFERRYSAGGRPGTIRLQTWLNEADMASYSAATALLLANPNDVEGDIAAARAFRHKYGFGLNWEQEVATNIGVFSRLGWNDGQEETWTFTDANWSASLGSSFDGNAWGRSGDTIGLAGVVSGASTANQKFLQAGGLDMLDGDGALSYAPEDVLETYYDRLIGKRLHGTLDYQFVANPAFNQARGPVSIFGVRMHSEF